MKLTIFITLLFSVFNVKAIEINNFKSGLMCGANKEDLGWICFEQEEILITGQSSCLSSNKEYKCTWFGYSFNYKKAKIGQTISCNYTLSTPMKTMNLYSMDTIAKKSVNFKFTLDKEKGFFINPQYTVIGTSSNDEVKKETQDVVCSSEGTVLYTYRFISVFPPK